MTDQGKSYFFTMLVILFWSTVPTAFKISLRFLSIFELLLYSTLTSTGIIFLILFWQKKLKLLGKLSGKDFLFSALMGFLNPFAYYLVLFKSYSLLPAQQAQPLNLIWGVVLVLMSIPVLKQKFSLSDFICLGITFFGVVIISTEGNLAYLKVKNPLGISLALGSSLFWAFYWLLNVKDKKDTLLRLGLNFSFASIYILILICFIHPPIPSLSGLLGSIYIGLFEMGIAYFLWMKALKLSKKTIYITIIIYIIPFISFLFVHFFLKEKIMISSILGAIFIVGGILIHKLKDIKRDLPVR